jgi:hypothetical protein
MSFLIPIEKLAASRARYEQTQAAKAAPAPAFVYPERTELQWSNRAHQSETSFEPKEIKPPKTPRTKAVLESTPCTCGHNYGNHDRSHPSYPPLKPEFATGDVSKITTPCMSNSGCDCWNFVNAETGKPAGLKRPKVMPHVLCQKCQHPRGMHCTARKASKAKRKPWKQEWEGFERDGQVAACKHTTMAVWYRCTSTACAANDGENWCSCARYVSPLSKPKLAKPVSKPRKSRNSKPVAALPAVAANDSTPPPRPRRTSKKTTAFMTGTPDLFPPVVEVNS